MSLFLNDFGGNGPRRPIGTRLDFIPFIEAPQGEKPVAIQSLEVRAVVSGLSSKERRMGVHPTETLGTGSRENVRPGHDQDEPAAGAVQGRFSSRQRSRRYGITRSGCSTRPR